MKHAVALFFALAACSKEQSEYLRKSKQTEAKLQLNKLLRSAKVYAAERGKFPVGTAPVTPAVACCDQKAADFKCQPDATIWRQSPWQELEFSIDEPHRYRYAYSSDGTKLTLSAVGDLDCDRIEATWTLTATIAPDGSVESQLVEPAPQAD